MLDFVLVIFALAASKISLAGIEGDTIEINYSLDGAFKQKSLIYHPEQVYHFSNFSDSSRGELALRKPIVDIPIGAENVQVKFTGIYRDSISLGKIASCVEVGNQSGVLFVDYCDEQKDQNDLERVERTTISLRKNWKSDAARRLIYLRNDSIQILVAKEMLDTSWYFVREYLEAIENGEIAKNQPLDRYSKKASNTIVVERLTARVLEKGECQVYLKEANRRFYSIRREKFSFYCGGLCGGAGRRFYIGDLLILSVIDQMS